MSIKYKEGDIDAIVWFLLTIIVISIMAVSVWLLLTSENAQLIFTATIAVAFLSLGAAIYFYFKNDKKLDGMFEENRVLHQRQKELLTAIDNKKQILIERNLTSNEISGYVIQPDEN